MQSVTGAIATGFFSNEAFRGYDAAMTNLNLKVTLPVAILILTFCLPCAAQEKQKLTYGILVDSTGSMRTQFKEVLLIAKSVVDQLHERGPVSIFDFHSEGPGHNKNAQPKVRIEASQDADLLLKAIDQIYIEGGQTTLLDAIEFMRATLNKQSPDGHKVIILITDGEDRTSKTTRAQLVEDLRKDKITVFAIGLVQDLKNGKSKATNLLRTLADETGGRAVILESRTFDIDKLVSELALPQP